MEGDELVDARKQLDAVRAEIAWAQHRLQSVEAKRQELEDLAAKAKRRHERIEADLRDACVQLAALQTQLRRVRMEECV